MECDRVERRIDRAFVRHDPALLEPIREHLAQCERCSAHYSRLFELESALADPTGNHSPFSRAEQDFLRERVLGGAPVERRRGQRWLVIAAGMLVSTAAALLAVVWLRPAIRQDAVPLGSSGPGTFATRGGLDASAATSPLGIRALCVFQAADGRRHVKPLGSPQPGPDSRCRLGDTLALTYRNETGVTVYARIVVVTADGHSHVVFPTTGNHGALSPQADETPIRAWLPLEVAGRLMINADFFRGPSSPDADVRPGRDAQQTDSFSPLYHLSIQGLVAR